MSAIQCEALIRNISSWAIVRLPGEVSEMLASRGMVMITGTINQQPFTVPLEPDGKGGHWFRVSEDILLSCKLKTGDQIKLEFLPTDDWLEPVLPDDIELALNKASLYDDTWKSLTPKAKWEWLRWIRSAKNPVTRTRRIDIAIDKLHNGNKRPCCFNSAMCTEPAVSLSGILLDR